MTNNGTSSATRTERETLLDQLREVNERLIISAVRSQELAEQAEGLRADAAAANALKDEAMALVSHELRTPLNAILGWTRLLRVGRLDAPGTVAAIHTVERNAKALARVVDDLLDVSRLVGGRIQLAADPVDLAAVVGAAVEELRPAAETKPVALTFTRPPGPDFVAGDPVRLQQVVANLLSNALKFTPAGGRVDVDIRALPADGTAEIRVADTGRGIAAEFIPRMFEQFAQADPSTTRQQGGLGLGLAIVRALVAQHHGTVHAASAGLGAGATFIVRLPTCPGATGAMARANAGAGATPEQGRLDGIRIVLVEDNADGRNALTLLLEFAGAQVMAAASVHAAQSAIETFRPNVIVSDIGLPDEDGYALLARVRARGDRTPAVALTGYARPAEKARILAAGFHMHLRKPVDPDALVAAIVATLRAA